MLNYPKEVLRQMKTTIIGIAGGSGSGKSTFTNRLKNFFGDNITVIYHDNYYRANDDLSMEERRKINYDHPQALETDLLVEHLEALRNGDSIKCPVYDFTQHNRSDKTVTINPSRVIVVEGILIFQDERLRDLFDIKIFVEADADERILRRVVRDMEERGRELQDIIEHYLATVKPMHYLYVEPTRNVADIVLNSGLNDVAFEVMKNKIERILDNPDED
jgi:uridine kinase